MSPCLSLLLLLTTANPVETKFVQLAPVEREAAPFAKSAQQTRAVLLIHGFRPHPFDSKAGLQASWHSWQKADSGLVQALGKEADVFAFAYSQNNTVEHIAESTAFRKCVAELKQLGYADIVLLGHSTGGLIARQFVEDHPDAGVTKVIQVGTPNGGTAWAKTTFGVSKDEQVFLQSLTPDGRKQVLKERAEKKIPAKVDFVCVVCRVSSAAGDNGDGDNAAAPSDGVVCCDCQWCEDLQRQGIPAVALACGHLTVMRTKPGEEKILELVRQKQPRWDQTKVNAEKSSILGTAKSAP
jgi:hypothetical protein